MVIRISIVLSNGVKECKYRDVNANLSVLLKITHIQWWFIQTCNYLLVYVMVIGVLPVITYKVN